MEKASSHYTWDAAADKWAKRFNEIELKDLEKTWLSPLPKIKTPKTELPKNLKNAKEITSFIFNEVLCKPEWEGSHIWKRMLRDLTFGYRCENMNKEFYFNESHVKTQKSNSPFSPEDALKEMLNFRNQINSWEEARLKKIGAAK